MGIKEIANRIKKLESMNHAPDMVELLVLEDGKERHVCMTAHDATVRALGQDVKYMFGTGERDENRILKVISGDDSGMINAIISCEVEKGSALEIIQTEIKEEEKWHGNYYEPKSISVPEPEPEPIPASDIKLELMEEPKEKLSMRDEIMQAIKRRKDREQQDKDRENKANIINSTSAERECVSHI